MTTLVLWDVDGTLVHAGPAGGEVFVTAVARALGRPAGEQLVRMSGKTDPQIALELLALNQVDGSEARDHLPAILGQLGLEMAEAEARIRAEGRVHPGVVEVLSRLHARPDVVQSLLTGNIAPNGRVKVSAFGLDRWLDLDVGAYGSDDHDRRRLVPVALAKVRDRYGTEVAPDDVWVVGDTPRDLECAQVAGAHCLLVATGGYSRQHLEGLGADVVLDDLADVDAVVRLLAPASERPS